MDEDDETFRQDCRSWEEDLYWTHFRSLHFFQFLRGDFRTRLALPKKFADNMKNKLGENVILKGPSGSVWKVGLVAEEGGLFFKKGWKEFVKDQPLSKNDMLMFKYTEASRFEVLVFDGQSLCEKEVAYFCKRSGQNERECEAGVKRKAREGSEVVTASPLGLDRVAHVPAEEHPEEEEIVPAPRTRRARKIVTPKRASDASPLIQKSSSPAVVDLDEQQVSVKSPSASPTPSKEKKVVRRKSAHKDSPSSHVFVPRKKSTVENPAQLLALQHAQAAAKSESFLVVMQPTHVYKRFYMSIPVEWADRHIRQCNQDIILRVEDKTWKTRYYYNARNCGGISGGWRNFALENHLQVSDVCLFDLGESIDDAVVLDVTIFGSREYAIPAVPESYAPATEEYF